MYHRFSSVTGRVVAAANVQTPLYPLRPILLQRAVPASVTYDSSVKITPIQVRQQHNRFIEGTNIPCTPVSEEIKRKQALFQADNDLPVHLKGGPMDAVLYRLTMGLVIVGLGLSIYEIGTMAMKP